jgi:hypothetical protein
MSFKLKSEISWPNLTYLTSRLTYCLSPSPNYCVDQMSVGQTLFIQKTLSLTTLSINDTQHNNALPLCWVSLCWVSHFIHCYAECHCTKCSYADCHSSECHSSKFRGTEVKDWSKIEWNNTFFCIFIDCRGHHIKGVAVYNATWVNLQ